ncbi:HAUS augmin-like complex subunit 6 N-terminus-domain-containing protein [Calycina marina]|uniref:HAUS augmin-like complex subunit 6 N-terminus-domain-containing protein n=1 Tax=Calycina marina TaxID=1763456 RepID=A0A9P8CGR2_9HELO|nr:HAUS augmin-like complex subunit 6 N-terminus-domain-containing protein [Calycina marina]
MSNTLHARSRSLRSNILNLKPSVIPTTQAPQGPLSISLFLTNLRLLNLDLRDDWPEMTTSTFSTKDQKKRIQSVEWALYQLFMLWDLEEARDKLQPFFPPLEPLQSLNLRAALLRCLEQAKKSGVLGREVILRKTMLDECKGERLEEILAVFSNAVLKRVLQQTDRENSALAHQLALENFSYSGERSKLSALIVAHKASLSKHLREKDASRAQYKDFSDLLNLNERRITRRQEQLKQIIADRGVQHQISEHEIAALHSQIQKNWSGSDQWLQTILYGDNMGSTDPVLATPLEKLWKHVENGSIGGIEAKQQVGLLEQLNSRVKNQEARLAKWQSFGKSLKKVGSPVKSQVPHTSTDGRNIDLGFTQHQVLQLPRAVTESAVNKPETNSLREYKRMVENLKAELVNVNKPKVIRLADVVRRVATPEAVSSNVTPLSDRSPIIEPVFISPYITTGSVSRDEEDCTFEIDAEEIVPSPAVVAKKPFSTPKIGRAAKRDEAVESDRLAMSKSGNDTRHEEGHKELGLRTRTVTSTGSATVPRPQLPSQSPPRVDGGTDTQLKSTEETDLANKILDSISASSPSPKKRHTLSLAERTRLTMSRASHSKYSELHDDVEELSDLPRLSIKPLVRAEKQLVVDPDTERHAELIERTRKSMAGFEAAQKKAQIERRRSVRDSKKKSRESTYFLKVEEEPPSTPNLDPVELIGGDPDYESVFKSRPKIATSPAMSPARILEELYEE